MSGPQAAWLPDGRRLHLNHGPIDLILEACGAPGERRSAPIAQAAARLPTILEELVAELPALRQPRRHATRHSWGRGAAHGGGGLPPCRRASSPRWPRSPAPSPTRCWRP